MNNCIFCDIISDSVSSLKVYENAHTCVFMDTAEDVDGHMIVVPKRHVKCITDCDETTLHHVMDTVKRITDHCVTQCGYSGVNLLHASGECAGQSISHFHIHVIPRKKGDGIDAWPMLPGIARPTAATFQTLCMRKL